VDPLIYAFALYLVALLLFIIDLFIPTGGILLVCGAICEVIAIYFGFRSSTTTGLLMLLLVLVTVPVLFFVFLRAWPHTPIGRRVTLAPKQNAEPGLKDELRNLIGFVVVNRWPLAPTGQIQIGRRRYNAMSSDGSLIDIQLRVKVIDVHERMLVVCQTSEPLSDPNSTSIKPGTNSQIETVDPLQIPAENLGIESLDD
jgi:membrane-bound ClpP family serine protease